VLFKGEYCTKTEERIFEPFFHASPMQDAEAREPPFLRFTSACHAGRSGGTECPQSKVNTTVQCPPSVRKSSK
jgi:hypothetical protein